MVCAVQDAGKGKENSDKSFCEQRKSKGGSQHTLSPKTTFDPSPPCQVWLKYPEDATSGDKLHFHRCPVSLEI